MQTKRQIQELLARADVSANKRLGQHFLIDLNLMRLLVDSAQIEPQDVVLEAGCGTGSLTEALAGRAAAVIAVEIDKVLFEIVSRQLDHLSNVRLLNTDVLQNKNTIAPAVVDAVDEARKNHPGRLLLVANLPYHAGSALILDLLKLADPPDAMVVTVQKEVADRMLAGPGCSDYGSLSVMLSATGDPELIRVIKPSVFWPKPQVDSAMIRYVRRPQKAARIANIGLLSIVVAFFIGHRRKTLRACTRFASGKLATVPDWEALLAECSLDPQSRPDRIGPDQYVVLANRLWPILSSRCK